MSRLEWGTPGSRRFETGVDQGVLFPPIGVTGVAWNGLIAVKEEPTGGEIQSYYQDGIKYHQVTSSEEFKASLEAFSAPSEFALCDGVASIFSGLLITQQPRKKFDLCYRTFVGNDILGEKYGYKLHFVYNAIASSPVRDNRTISETTDPLTLTWDIETVPPAINGFKPSSHIIVNSLTSYDEHVIAIENMVYGQEGGANSRMPTIAELITVFNTPPISTSYGHGSYGHTPYGGY